jgi:hypothetical protein
MPQATSSPEPGPGKDHWTASVIARRESFLRLTIQLSLKTWIVVRVFRLIANHLHLAFFESTPEVRAFPPPALPSFIGRDTVRLPPMPPPEATLRPLPSHRTGVGNGERGPIAAGSARALRFHCQSHNDKSHLPPPRLQ